MNYIYTIFTDNEIKQALKIKIEFVNDTQKYFYILVFLEKVEG